MSNLSSALYVGLSQGAKILTSFASLAVLSRLLAPQEFGTFALVLAIIGIGELFRDFGLSLAGIQATEITESQRSNLFWANTVIGLLLSAVTMSIAPLIAAVYGDARLTPIVIVVASTFLLNGASAQYRVGLVRAGGFKQLAIVDTLSPILALVAAIVAAEVGLGVYSLVTQALGLAIATLVMLVGFGRWLPGLPNRHDSIRSFIGVGSQLLSVQIISYISNNLDKVLVGKLYGAASLGFYSKAYTLYLQPLNQLLAPFTNLVVAALSKVREAPSQYLALLLRVQLAMNYAGFPVFAFVVGAAPSIVPLLLGPNWQPTIAVLQILCVGGTFQLFGFIYYWHFLAAAHSRTFLRCALVSQPIAIALVIASAPFGTLAIAWGVSLGFFVEWLVPAVWGMPRTLERSSRLLRNMLRPLVVAVAVLVGSSAGSILLQHEGPVLQLIVSVAATVVLVAVLVVSVPSIRRDAGLAAEVVRARLRGRRGVTAS